LTTLYPATKDKSLVFFSLVISIEMNNTSSLLLKLVSFSYPPEKWFPRKIPSVSKA
jgi:hypothetical protein